MYHRGFRGSRRRSTPMPVRKTFKKILNFIPASFGAGFTNETLAFGKDNISPKQTTAIDPDIPTGSILRSFELQFAVANLVEVACFVNCSIQYKLAGQSFVNPDTLGGNNQRNQVLHQELFSVGARQNSTHKFKFKIPKKFQRMRENMEWAIVWSNTASVTRMHQTIYKFEH